MHRPSGTSRRRGGLATLPEATGSEQRRISPLPILTLSLASGVVAIAYEVLWTRELLNLLGSTTRASALVLSGFMSGLALGAYIAGRLTIRVGRPLRLYVAAEGALSVVGVAFPSLLPALARLIPHDAALDAVLLLLLLAPALFMGAALPALAAALQSSGASDPRHIAILYGLNTLGGALAALGVGLGALPGLGLCVSEYAAAGAGLGAAVLAAIVARQSRPLTADAGADDRAPSVEKASGGMARAAILTALCLSGMAALGYEVLWTRILVLVVGSSSNAFAIMLGLYLLGLAVGGFGLGRLSGWVDAPAGALQLLQLAIAATALAGAALFGTLPAVALLGYFELGTSVWSIATVNVLIAAAIILPPTIFIGASFPVAARLLAGTRPRRGREVGLALAVTTVGNVGGILIAAFGIVPTIGLQRGVAALTVVNLAAALILLVVRKDDLGRLRHAIPGAAVVATVVILWLPRWDVAVMTSGVFRQAPVYLALIGSPERLEQAFAAYRTLYYREGSESVVAVYDRPTLAGTPHRVLTVDGKVDASTGADMATQVLSGYLPFLFHPEAGNALVIGLASGVTVGALTRHPLEHIEVVEIEPAVVPASRAFDEVSGAPLEDPRVRVVIDDGRRYLQRTERRYDLIVSEPSNPWLSMSARLFTREFFQRVHDRLQAGGLLVQWLPLYGLSKDQFEVLLRTLLDVFPNVSLFRVAEGDLIAIAGREAFALHSRSLDRLFEGAAEAQLEQAGIGKAADLLARWVAGGRGLREVVGPGPLNTDDNGLLEFGSPWYLMSETSADNLALVTKASLLSDVAARLVEVWASRGGELRRLEDLATRYLGQDRPDQAHSLAAALRSSSHLLAADLLAGDAANAEGRLSEAATFWERHEAPAFWLRRARLAFKLSQPAEAARLFAKVPHEWRSPEDDLLFALALVDLGRSQKALDLLETVTARTGTATGVLVPFVSFALHKETGSEARARAERRRFEERVDELRRCLELDGCNGVVRALLGWTGVPVGMPAPAWEILAEELVLRITRPMPHYLRGVTSLWLGDEEEARRSLETYLKLLPEPDPRSRAHSFLGSEPTPPNWDKTAERASKRSTTVEQYRQPEVRPFMRRAPLSPTGAEAATPQ